MRKIDATVLRETLFIAVWVILFSAVMESVFLIAGAWDYKVILGNILGIIAAVLNFFLMGLGVQSALGKSSEDAAKLMRMSQSLRMLMLFVFAAIAVLAPIFNIISALVPLLFPRIAIMLRPLFDKQSEHSSQRGEDN